jgi:tetratricopeptide (TPR) repeat protein
MRSFITMALLLWLTAISGQSRHQVDAIFQSIDALLSECRYVNTRNYIEQTLRTYPKLNQADRARLYLQLSELHIAFGDFETALETGIQALSAALTSSSPLLVAETRINLIKTRQIVGMGWENPEYTLEAMELAQKGQNNRLLRNTYLILGMQYFVSQDYPKAIAYYKDALSISSATKIPEHLHHDKLMMSLSHLTLGNMDSSYWYVQQVKQSALNLGDSMYVAKALLTESLIHITLGEISQSQESLDKSIAISRELKLPLVLTSGLTQKMSLSMATKDFKTAINLGKKALEIFPTSSALFVKSYVDSLLYASYLGLQEYQLAHQYFISYTNTRNDFNEKYLSFQSKQIELIQKTREQKLVINNQELRLLSEQRKTSFIIVLNILFITIIVVLIALQIINYRHNRTLFKKEQMISELMDESANNRTLLLQNQAIPIIDEFNEAEVTSPDIDLTHRKMLYEQLLSLLEKEKLYLDPELNRSSLITLLGTNKKYLHQATKHIGKTHLNHILNRYRVREAKHIIEQSCAHGRLALPDELYMQAGFNSKSSYYRIFKDFTGMSPKDYALACSRKNDL